jgi:hypothetical protein
MDAKTEYQTLAGELAAVEKAQGGLYLADENIDRENVLESGLAEHDEGFWPAMLANLKQNAGMRAEEKGLHINVLIGRVIY